MTYTLRKLYTVCDDERQRLEDRIREREHANTLTAAQRLELRELHKSHREVEQQRNSYLATLVALRARGKR
ncbi:hypothetical protein [Natronolimnobius baerhuensis]|uniref:Uncharacterized protein n=1 Tax=Natronolimnobius baerhuensis TaxID=253108 RepID=A0A202E7T8_9EURY|nr:hypothetical protein [Natronolimnobius baerhuensis]OVE84325.1 hypothetical protein B2G88_07875 [Natronolimnobius baerhuensis]